MIFTTEKSRDLCKWCILLCHGLVSLSLNFLPPNDLKKYLNRIEHYSNISNGGDEKVTEEVSDFDEKKALQIEDISSNDEKKALISSKQIENSSTITTSNAPPPISPIGQVSLKKFEKQISNLKNQYRPIISSPLNPNRQQSSNDKDNKSDGEDEDDKNLSKRYFTIANSRPKRTQTMKLISSTAIYRFFNQKSNVLAKTSSADPEEFHYASNKSSKKSSSENNDKDGDNVDNGDKNIRLDCERPTFHQQPRKSHKNLSPAVTLQVSRKYLKIMVRIRRHRNTI